MEYEGDDCMGYESRLFVVDKTKTSKGINNPDMWYAQKIAEFDLCKVDDISSEICKNYKPTDCFFYVGNNELVDDAYGDPLLEIPVSDMIQMLEEAMKTSNYRRFNPFLQMLKGFDLTQWNNLVVLHYGY